MSRKIYFFDDNVLRRTVQKAFELSAPQGMGWMHYNANDTLDDQTVDTWLEGAARRGGPLSLDYVKGRAVKLCFHYDDEKTQFYVEDGGTWFDHSDRAWAELLAVAESES